MAEKIVIIGSGPAGWTCALYASRANLEPLVYEGAISEDNRLRGTLPLGQLNLTTEVENFPGFPDGVLGPDLMIKMKIQAERYGARVVTEDVTDLDLSARPFRVTDSAGTTVEAHSLVIATGAIGHTPNTAFLRGQLETDDKGFIVLKDPFRTTTSVEGVYAAGDVADPTYKQAITAAGMGCKAALDAERWLAAKGIH